MSEHFEPSKENESVNIQPETAQAASVEEVVETAAKASGAKYVLKEIGSWIMCIAVALVIALTLRTYVFTVVRVDGRSMCPTLQNNERLFARIIGYTPERGDIIIFNPKSNPDVAYVKRVIATEGDRIWIDESNGDVHLKKAGTDEWEIIEENYITYESSAPYATNGQYNSAIPNIAQRISDNSGEEGLLIEEDHIFVMGDNRNHSNDSRNDIGGNAVGQVHVDSVIGKASFRWWPLSEFGGLY